MRVLHIAGLVVVSLVALACATQKPISKKHVKPRKQIRKRVMAKKVTPKKTAQHCLQSKLVKIEEVNRPDSEFLVSDTKKEALTLYLKNGKKFKELVSSYETKMNSYEHQDFLADACVSVVEVYDNWEHSYPVVYDHLNAEEYTLGSGGDYMAAHEGKAFSLWNCHTLTPQTSIGRCQDDAEIEFYNVNSKGIRYSSGSYLLSYILGRLGAGVNDALDSVQGVSRIYLEPQDDYLKYEVILKANEFENDCKERCDHLQYSLGSIEFSMKAGQVSLKSAKAHLRLISQD